MIHLEGECSYICTEQAHGQDRSITYLQGECSYRRTEQAHGQDGSMIHLEGECSYRRADSVRWFNVGLVLFLNKGALW